MKTFAGLVLAFTSAVFALLVAGTAAGAINPPEPITAESGVLRLTLPEARRLAFLHNWDLLAAKSDVDAAVAQRLVSREFPNPTLSVGTFKINADGHPSSTDAGNGFWDRNYDSIAAINQLFEIGGKRRARKDSATAGVGGAEARLADSRRLLDQGVTQAYVTALLAQAKLRILGDSATSLRREAEIARSREQAGEISLADEKQIVIAADRFELDAATAEVDSRSALIALGTLLGERQPSTQVQLLDSLEALAESQQMETNAIFAPRTRPDIRAAQGAVTKAEADFRLQKAMRVPDPTFLAQYEHEPPDQPNTVGFAVSLSIPLWNRNSGNISAAQAALELATVQLEKIQAQADAEVAAAQMRYLSVLSRWQRYRKELGPRSGEVLDTVEFAYRKGSASLLDLLSAQRNDNDVRLATAQAAADAADAAATLRSARYEAPSSARNSLTP